MVINSNISMAKVGEQSAKKMQSIQALRPPAAETTGKDSYAASIQNRISTIQEQMDSLSENETMSPEEKAKKRQELQKEIAQLNQQLRQHQIEQRKKQQEDTVAKAAGNGGSSRFKDGFDESEEKQQGISLYGASSILSASNAMKQIKTQDGIRTALTGEKRVLEAQIKQDKANGGDTTYKENRIDKIEQNVKDLEKQQIKTFEEAEKEIEKNKESEAAQEGKGHSEEKVDNSDKAEKEERREKPEKEQKAETE